MRTSLWIAMGLLLLTILAGVLTGRGMQQVSEQYAASARELRSLTEASDWPAAREKAEACLRDWRTRLPTLQMLINHDDTDSVTLSLVTLLAAIDAQDRTGCLIACSELHENAQHLYHRDAFTWANVL